MKMRLKTTQETTMELAFCISQLNEEQKLGLETKSIEEVYKFFKGMPTFQEQFLSIPVLEMTLKRFNIVYGLKKKVTKARNYVNDMQSLIAFMLRTYDVFEKIKVFENKIDLTELEKSKAKLESMFNLNKGINKVSFQELANFSIKTYEMIQQIEELIGFEKGSLQNIYKESNVQNIRNMANKE